MKIIICTHGQYVVFVTKYGLMIDDKRWHIYIYIYIFFHSDVQKNHFKSLTTTH